MEEAKRKEDHQMDLGSLNGMKYNQKRVATKKIPRGKTEGKGRTTQGSNDDPRSLIKRTRQWASRTGKEGVKGVLVEPGHGSSWLAGRGGCQRWMGVGRFWLGLCRDMGLSSSCSSSLHTYLVYSLPSLAENWTTGEGDKGGGRGQEGQHGGPYETAGKTLDILADLD